jgi:methylglutaconyl-CoA hydratase
MSKKVAVSITDGVGSLVIESEGTRNALSIQLLRDLFEGLNSLEEDSGIHLITLTAQGPVFSAGMDLKNVDLSDRASAEMLSELLSQVYQKILFSRVPVLVGVDGPVFGGAAGIVLSSDWIVLGPQAMIAFPEVRLGLVPALVSVAVRRRMTPGRLKALALMGTPIAPQECLQWGLADVLASDSAGEEVARTAERMVHQNAPGAMQRTKAFLNSFEEEELRASFEEARIEFLMSVTTPEAARGLVAFRNKERPDWSDETS